MSSFPLLARLDDQHFPPPRWTVLYTSRKTERSSIISVFTLSVWYGTVLHDLVNLTCQCMLLINGMYVKTYETDDPFQFMKTIGDCHRPKLITALVMEA